jgi:hypothetical protein
MASKENKMIALQEFGKSLRRGEGGAAIAKLLYYSSNPTPVDVSTKSTVTKNNNKRKGISKSILNQSNLLKKKSKNKKLTNYSLGKKSLLGKV